MPRPEDLKMTIGSTEKQKQLQMEFDFINEPVWEKMESALMPDNALANCCRPWRDPMVTIRGFSPDGKKDSRGDWNLCFCGEGLDADAATLQRNFEAVRNRFRLLRPSVAKVWRILINRIALDVRYKAQCGVERGEIREEMDVGGLAKMIGISSRNKCIKVLKEAFTTFGAVRVIKSSETEWLSCSLGSVRIEKRKHNGFGGYKYVATIVVDSLAQEFYRQIYPIMIPTTAWKIDGQKTPYAFVLTDYLCGLVQMNSRQYIVGGTKRKPSGFQILPADDLQPQRAVQRVKVKTLLDHTRIKYEGVRKFGELVVRPFFKNLDAIAGFFWRFDDGTRFYDPGETPDRETFLNGTIEFTAWGYPLKELSGNKMLPKVIAARKARSRKHGVENV